MTKGQGHCQLYQSLKSACKTTSMFEKNLLLPFLTYFRRVYFIFSKMNTFGKSFTHNYVLYYILSYIHILSLSGSIQTIELLRVPTNFYLKFQIIKAYPILLHLLTPEHRPPLSLKMLTHLLQPQFSAVGSNKRVIESIVYQKFIKYIREVAGMITKFVHQHVFI